MFFIDTLFKDEILEKVDHRLVDKMEDALVKGLHFIDELNTSLPKMELTIEESDIYSLYKRHILLDILMEELKILVDLEKNNYPWLRAMDNYSAYYMKAEEAYSKMVNIRVRILDKKIKFRGEKDTLCTRNKKIKMMKLSLSRIVKIFEDLRYRDPKYYEKLSDKLSSLNPTEVIKELDKFDFNYIDENQQSYYLFEMLVVFVLKMRLEKPKAKDRQNTLMRNKKDFISSQWKVPSEEYSQYAGLLDLWLWEVQEMNDVHKNQISSYAAIVFKRFYNFTDEQIRGIMKFIFTDTTQNTSFLKEFYPDVNIKEKIVNGVKIPNVYEKEIRILYPHLLLNLNEV